MRETFKSFSKKKLSSVWESPESVKRSYRRIRPESSDSKAMVYSKKYSQHFKYNPKLRSRLMSNDFDNMSDSKRLLTVPSRSVTSSKKENSTKGPESFVDVDLESNYKNPYKESNAKAQIKQKFIFSDETMSNIFSRNQSGITRDYKNGFIGTLYSKPRTAGAIRSFK